MRSTAEPCTGVLPGRALRGWCCTSGSQVTGYCRCCSRCRPMALVAMALLTLTRAGGAQPMRTGGCTNPYLRQQSRHTSLSRRRWTAEK